MVTTWDYQFISKRKSEKRKSILFNTSFGQQMKHLDLLIFGEMSMWMKLNQNMDHPYLRIQKKKFKIYG